MGFQKLVVVVRKFLDEYAAGGEKFAHITKEEVEKVKAAFDPKVKFLDDAVAKQSALPDHVDPAVTTVALQAECDALGAVARPVMNKPIPKPEPAASDEAKPQDGEPMKTEGPKDDATPES